MADILEKGLEVLGNAYENVSNIISENKEVAIGTGIAAAGIATGTIVGAAIAKKRKRKSTKRKKSKSRRKYKHKRKSKRGKTKRRLRRRSRGRRTPRTAGRGRDTSHRRIRYTKKGQPYVILSNGRARFIKKTSAKRSHKQKGGRY